MVNQHDERNPIELLAEEFIQRRRRGEGQSVEECARSHPELADEIRRLFPAVIAMEDVKNLVVSSGDRPIELRVDKLEQLGDYRILREIGRGGMGIVYEAEQQSLGRLVAVKVFPQQVLGDSRKLRRFRREARVAALLHHTNIVQVFGVGDQDGLSYYVMQLIRGVSLDKVIDRLRTPGANGDGPLAETGVGSETEEPGRIPAPFTAADAARAMLGGRFDAWSASADPASWSTSSGALKTSRDVDPGGSSRPAASQGDDVPRQDPPVNRSSAKVLPNRHRYWRCVAQIGVQVGEALRYAHAHGTLHRDIKPANLLLDPKGTVWVTDFGVARAVAQEQLSRSGEVVGTLRYMSPEQLGGECDERSDVYSLGLTLYELITWRSAFGEAGEDGLVHRMLKGDPARPRRLQPGVPRDLETIVLKGIARDPRRRYQTAGELIDDLTRFLDGRPIRARRVGPVERLWRWSRRNPAVASLSTVLALVVLASFAAVGWKWREAESEKWRAQEENRRAESNLSLALDSMGQFLDRFESTWMAHPHDPESEEADVDFHVAVSDKSAAVLREALAFYDQFAAQNAANARLQLDTADAHRRVGEIHERLGEYGQAEKAYHRAIEIYDCQLRGSAQAPDLTLLTASTLNQLGRVERILGRLENARTYFSRAGQVLAEEADDSHRFRYELAHTHGNLGSVLWHLQQPAEAVRSDRRAIELLERLVDEEPGQAEYRLALARAYRRHHPFGSENPGGRNRQWFRAKAVSIIEDLVKEFPRVPDYRCELSETLAMVSFEPRPFGDFGGPPQRRGSRESQLRRAVDLAKALTGEYPEIPRYRAASARSQENLAWLLHSTGRPYAAEPLLSAAVALYEDLWEEYPTVEAYQFFLAMALQSHGNVLRDVDRLTESRRAIQRAIELQESYLKARPDTAFGKSMLARQNDSLAKTLTLLGEEDEAAEASRQAKEIRNNIKPFGKREGRQP